MSPSTSLAEPPLAPIVTHDLGSQIAPGAREVRLAPAPAPAPDAPAARGGEPFDLPVDDDELARQALAADPEAAVDADAVPLSEVLGDGRVALLPSWYMPSPFGATRVEGWRRRVAILLIVAFLLINAVGLCVTYGRVVIA